MSPRTLTSLAELAALVRERPGLHVRYSKGPEADGRESSFDTESGLEMPGLSVNPLDAEAWWTRPLEDWLARQLSQYRELMHKDNERRAWVLRGRCVGRGPDCEPLLAEVEPVAWLSEELLQEAEERYRRNFDAGRGPPRTSPARARAALRGPQPAEVAVASRRAACVSSSLVCFSCSRFCSRSEQTSVSPMASAETMRLS